MDLVLDSRMAAEICAAEQAEGHSSAQDALDKCYASGGKIWLFVGAIAEMQAELCSLLRATTPGHMDDVVSVAKAHLNNFARGKQWLAALAPDGKPFCDSREHLLRAMRRFGDGQAKVLTRDAELLVSARDATITPEQFLGAEFQTAIKFIDLDRQLDEIRPTVEERIQRVLHHGQYVMGPEVQELESLLADYVGTKHCVACSDGTKALLIAMMALDIGPGDEVITTPFTFIATGEMIALLRAKPVFVDVEPDTFNIDPRKIGAAITARTRAIMPVALFGQCADMDAINAIAEAHGIPVIEDAAQSFGATYQGRKSGSLSRIGCTSFFPSKPLGCYGDGGACFTDDEELAAKMRRIRVHGQERRYRHVTLGINGRLDTVQAAVLLAKMTVFERELLARQNVAQLYNDLLSSNPQLITPKLANGRTSAYAQYTILVRDRTRVQEHLKTLGIPTAVHYPIPLHRQPIFQATSEVGDYPISERLATEVLSLPMHPYLDPKSQQVVAAGLAQCTC